MFHLGRSAVHARARGVPVNYELNSKPSTEEHQGVQEMTTNRRIETGSPSSSLNWRFLLGLPVFMYLFDDYMFLFFLFYLLHGGLLTYCAIKADKTRLQHATTRDLLIDKMVQASLNTGYLLRFRLAIVKMLKAIIFTISWPGLTIYHYMNQRASIPSVDDRISPAKPMQYANYTSVLSPEPFLAFGSLLVVFCCSIIFVMAPSQQEGIRYFYYLICFEILVRHACLTVFPNDIFTQLRITKGSILARFSAIVFFDYLSLLCLCFALLFYGHHEPFFQTLLAMHNKMTDWHTFNQTIFAGNISALHILIFSSGFMVFSAIKTIKRFKEFVITDEDRVNTAIIYSKNRMFSDALQHIDQSNMSNVDFNALLVRSVANVGTGNLDRSMDCIKKCLILKNMESTNDSVFRAIFASIAFYPIPRKHVLALFERAVAERIYDTYLLVSIGNLPYHDQIIIDDLYLYFSNDETKRHFCYTYGYMLILNNKRDQLGEVLIYNKRDTHVETLLFSLYSLINSLSIELTTVDFVIADFRLAKWLDELDELMNGINSYHDRAMIMFILMQMNILTSIVNMKISQRVKSTYEVIAVRTKKDFSELPPEFSFIGGIDQFNELVTSVAEGRVNNERDRKMKTV